MESNKSILLIEDDREISATIQSVLESVGYAVRSATNGVEGRQMIEDDQPDLVITDMMMPRMGGFPILDFICSLSKPPRVIMITANEGGRHKAYAELRGVADYLRKPFAMDVLLESVEKALKEDETKPRTKPKRTKKKEK